GAETEITTGGGQCVCPLTATEEGMTKTLLFFLATILAPHVGVTFEKDNQPMARYQLEDGTILDTVLALQRWRGAGKTWTRGVSTMETLYCSSKGRYWLSGGKKWERGGATMETLYFSSKGRYWLEEVSNWRGIAPTVRVLTPREAATWLLMQGYDMPPDLVDVAKNIEE